MKLDRNARQIRKFLRIRNAQTPIPRCRWYEFIRWGVNSLVGSKFIATRFNLYLPAPDPIDLEYLVPGHVAECVTRKFLGNLPAYTPCMRVCIGQSVSIQGYRTTRNIERLLERSINVDESIVTKHQIPFPVPIGKFPRNTNRVSGSGIRCDSLATDKSIINSIIPWLDVITRSKAK